MATETNSGTDWLAVSARAQAFLCLQAAGLSDAPIVQRAKFLMNLGISRADAASLLGSSDDSLRVQLGRLARKPKAADA